MASAGDSKHTRIEMKLVSITVIVIVSTLSLIASIVLITIGYLNPFGTVGLGILGGGCVLYFSSILFLCSSGIWVKNRYYADESDFREKWSQSSSEDISLLKPALNVTSPAKNESEYINETERQSGNNMVPLWSLSTVYSSVSSSVSTVPERGDAEGASDCDVFSNSLTAVQHTDIRLQEKLQLKKASEQIVQNCESTSERKIKDLEKRRIADLPNLHNNGKSVSDTQRQQKPMVMDFVGTTYSNTEEKQLMSHHITDQRKEGNDSNANSQICGRNNMSSMLCPINGPPRTAAQSKHHQHMDEQSKYKYDRKASNELTNNYSQEWKPALEKRKIHIGEKDNQTHDRRWCVIAEGDSWIQNPKVQGTTSKGLNSVPAAISDTDKMHRSCEKLHKISQERSEVPLQNLLPNTRLDQLKTVQLSNQMTTTSEHLNTKGKFMIKPGTRKGS